MLVSVCTIAVPGVAVAGKEEEKEEGAPTKKASVEDGGGDGGVPETKGESKAEAIAEATAEAMAQRA